MGPENSCKKFPVDMSDTGSGTTLAEKVQSASGHLPGGPSSSRHWTPAELPSLCSSSICAHPTAYFPQSTQSVFFKGKSDISISCLKLFNGFFGTKAQDLIWVHKAFMMWHLDIFPTFLPLSAFQSCCHFVLPLIGKAYFHPRIDPD